MRFDLHKLRRPEWAFALLMVLAGSGLLLFFQLRERAFDWIYFDSLALLIRSSLLQYNVFPLHDPWTCSGNSIIASPQNWLFSPLVLLTILFPPTLGNILSLVLLKVVGFFSARKYFLHIGADERVALLCAALFANLSWFSLHFAEGHITYRTFYLLPLAVLYGETLRDRKTLLKLAALFSFMILDGGIYPLIFSLVYLVFTYLLSWTDLRALLVYLRKDFVFFLSALTGALLLTLVKTWPVLQNSGLLKEVMDLQGIGPALLLKMFFDPTSSNNVQVPGPYRFHEYGSYLTISGFLLFLAALRSPKPLVRRLILMLLFLWIATGWGASFNPYTLIAQLPLLKKAHLPVRYVLLFTFAFLSIIAVSASSIRFRKVVIALLVLANVEGLVANYFSFPKVGFNYSLPLLTRQHWIETRPVVVAPPVYYADGLVSKFCYEPARKAPVTKAKGDPDYKGEVVPLEGSFELGQPRLIPGEITFNYKSQTGGVLRLNTNYLDGWVETQVGGEAFKDGELLGVRLPPGEGVVALQYLPESYTWTVMAALCGFLLLLFLARRRS